MGLENRQLPPENDTLCNAITQKHKVGMSTYIKICISLCTPEWYQSAQNRVLAHGLLGTHLTRLLAKPLQNCSWRGSPAPVCFCFNQIWLSISKSVRCARDNSMMVDWPRPACFSLETRFLCEVFEIKRSGIRVQWLCV